MVELYYHSWFEKVNERLFLVFMPACHCWKLLALTHCHFWKTYVLKTVVSYGYQIVWHPYISHIPSSPTVHSESSSVSESCQVTVKFSV